MGAFLAKKMKYFMVTMEERNFGKAAEVLCITRSPLSKAICELEEFLGGSLFNRTYNNLEPTELAWHYYHKCKSIYEALHELENECRSRSSESPLCIKFDISFPEILYQHVVMVLQSQQISFTAERLVVDLNEMENVSIHNNVIVISLREISLSTDCLVEKWQGDDLVLFMSDNIDDNQNELEFFIWEDLYSNYIKTSITRALESVTHNINFVFHNFNFTELLYNIHLGRGCTILPRKMATLFRLDGSKQKILKNKHVNICLYRPKDNRNDKQITKIKHIISSTL